MKIYVKIYEKAGERILAACDQELLGKKFSDGDLHLEVKKDFYNGTLIEIENLSEELKKATIVNLTGNNVVNFAIENNFVSEQNVLTISNVKHAQIVVL
jgi:hypothetical protein